MSTHLDPSATIPIECPKCGHKFEQSIAGLQAKPQFVCPNCRQRIDAKEFNAGLKKVDKIIDDFLGDVGKLFQ